MNIFAQPTSGDTNPANEAIRNFHFSLLQIRSLDLDHGVAEGVLARRLNDLSDDERALLRSKYTDDVLRMLAEKSLFLGKDIALYVDKIDTMAEAIDDAIEDLQTLQPPEQHQERLKDLKEDKRKLVDARQELEGIERQRVNATPETITQVQSQFTEFKDRFDQYASEFRTRSYSNRFDINSMGKFNGDDGASSHGRSPEAPPPQASHDKDDPSADAA